MKSTAKAHTASSSSSASIQARLASDATWTRIDVDLPSTNDKVKDDVHFWEAAVFATAAAGLTAPGGGVGGIHDTLIVCGSPVTAHMTAWAARCVLSALQPKPSAMLNAIVVASVTEDSEVTSSDPGKIFFSSPKDAKVTMMRPSPAKRCIVVISQQVLRDPRVNASAWTTGRTVITMPDVEHAEDFQALNSRAIFLHAVGENTTKPRKDPVATHLKVQLLPHFRTLGAALVAPAWSASGTAAAATDAFAARLTGPAGQPPRFDNQASWHAFGDVSGQGLQLLMHRLVAVYQTRSAGVAEEVIFNTLVLDRGGPHAAYVHHKLATLLRMLVEYCLERGGPSEVPPGRQHHHSSASPLTGVSDAARRECGGVTPDNLTLPSVAARAIARVCRTLPSLPLCHWQDGFLMGNRRAAASRSDKKKSDVEDDGNDEPASRRKLPSNRKNHAASDPAVAVGAADATANAPKPYLYLHATLGFLFEHIPHSCIDTLGMSWGIKKVICGLKSLTQHDKLRADVIHQLRKVYASQSRSQLGGSIASFDFAKVLLHVLTDVSGRSAPLLSELSQVLLWPEIGQGQYGPLVVFLHHCGLIKHHEQSAPSSTPLRRFAAKNDAAAKAKGTAPQQSSSSDYHTEVALLALDPSTVFVRPSTTSRVESLKYADLPLMEASARKTEMFHRMALDEILSALPTHNVPIYAGDIGKLIGPWTKFSARYESRLGATLTDFLMLHPDEFRVLDNVVMRVKAPLLAHPIQLRHDGEDFGGYDSDEHGDRQKKQKYNDGGADSKKKLHRKAKKVAHKSAQNKRIYDRNHKTVERSARVPGFIKRGPKKVKGRGHKVNARTFK